MLGKAARRKHFPSGRAIIRLINKKWTVYGSCQDQPRSSLGDNVKRVSIL
jgi:hypothetical protein